MTLGRIRLALAAAAFGGWLTWLGVAASYRGTVPIVSRAQVAGATHLVVAEVTATPENLPAATATLREVLRGPGPKPGDVIDVLNLPSARPPAGAFPLPGEYLLPLTGDGRTFRVAGLPESPGYPESHPARPAIYPWTPAVRAQVTGREP